MSVLFRVEVRRLWLSVWVVNLGSIDDSGSDPTAYKGQFGRYTDIESGLVYCHNRYYSPAFGRRISRDPIGLEGGLNVYEFCGNNPVMGADPSGLKPILLIVGGNRTDSLGHMLIAGSKWANELYAEYGKTYEFRVLLNPTADEFLEAKDNVDAIAIFCHGANPPPSDQIEVDKKHHRFVHTKRHEGFIKLRHDEDLKAWQLEENIATRESEKNACFKMLDFVIIDGCEGRDIANAFFKISLKVGFHPKPWNVTSYMLLGVNNRVWMTH